MSPGEAAPSVKTLEADIDAQGTAGTVQSNPIGAAPFAGTVTAARILPDAAVAFNASNFRTFNVVNKGQSGAGSTVVASVSTAAVSLVAEDQRDLTLSVVAGATTVAAGDILDVEETVTGTGVAHGGFKIEVDISRTGGS